MYYVCSTSDGIRSLKFKVGGSFVHNERNKLLKFVFVNHVFEALVTFLVFEKNNFFERVTKFGLFLQSIY